MDTRKKRQARKSISILLRWLMLSLLFVGTHALAQTGGTVTYVYTDPQGTPLAETDASGNITATFEYTPYGTYAPQGTSVPGPAPKGPGYTGHVNDPETSLVYMQARYYDPVTGRFLSTDPVQPSGGDAFGFNRYAYVSNNPVMRTDPDGKQDYSAQYLAAYRDCSNTTGCQPGDVPNQIAAAQAPFQSLLSLIPIASDVQNVTDAASDPSPLNVAAAAVGAVPIIGVVGSKVLKERRSPGFE